MIKKFTVVAVLVSALFTVHAQADDYRKMSAFQTKNLVKVKLWYEGISEKGSDKNNSKKSRINEELSVALKYFK